VHVDETLNRFKTNLEGKFDTMEVCKADTITRDSSFNHSNKMKSKKNDEITLNTLDYSKEHKTVLQETTNQDAQNLHVIDYSYGNSIINKNQKFNKNVDNKFINSGDYKLDDINLYYVKNNQNSIVKELDSNGKTVSDVKYQDFGRTLDIKDGPSYTGEDKQDSGLLYLRARFYHPGLGQFVSLDTYKGEKENILSQNRYVYTLNNPYKYTDPSGHYPYGAPQTPPKQPPGYGGQSGNPGYGLIPGQKPPGNKPDANASVGRVQVKPNYNTPEDRYAIGYNARLIASQNAVKYYQPIGTWGTNETRKLIKNSGTSVENYFRRVDRIDSSLYALDVEYIQKYIYGIKMMVNKNDVEKMIIVHEKILNLKDLFLDGLQDDLLNGMNTLFTLIYPTSNVETFCFGSTSNGKDVAWKVYDGLKIAFVKGESYTYKFRIVDIVGNYYGFI
jgi:RHS repeat-associated protein